MKALKTILISAILLFVLSSNAQSSNQALRLNNETEIGNKIRMVLLFFEINSSSIFHFPAINMSSGNESTNSEKKVLQDDNNVKLQKKYHTGYHPILKTKPVHNKNKIFY